MIWLAPWAGKMNQTDRALWLATRASLPARDYPSCFLDSVSFHKHAKRELCQCPLILTPRLANNPYYYILNSLTLFWPVGLKRTWNFQNQCPWRYYTIIMSRTLNVTGNYVMYDRSAWFLRVITLTSRHSCCLPSEEEEEEAETWPPSFCLQCIIKQLLDSVFVISKIIKVSVKVISLRLRLRLITLTSTLIILFIYFH